MPTGRKAVPTEQRRKRGEQTRELPVVVGGRGRPPMPPGLTPRMKVAWTAVVDDLARANILDRADWGVIEAFAVAVGRAREARAILNKEGLLATNSQGRVRHPLLEAETGYWREVRMLADQLPLSPWGRARLGLQAVISRDPAGAGDGGLEAELGAPPRLAVVGGNGG